MIYQGARPKTVFGAKYRKHRNQMLPHETKELVKALTGGTKRAKGASAFVEESSVVVHQKQEYDCRVVRVYVPRST